MKKHHREQGPADRGKSFCPHVYLQMWPKEWTPIYRKNASIDKLMDVLKLLETICGSQMSRGPCFNAQCSNKQMHFSLVVLGTVLVCH